VEEALAVDQGIAVDGYWGAVRQQLSSTLRGDLTQLASMVTIAPRLGAPGGSMAQPAGCIPLPTPVAVEVANLSAGSLVLPECTMVDRCGGCCSHPLLSCQPLLVETLQREVIVVDLVQGSDRLEAVEMEQHTSCSCRCTVQKHHCNSLQYYRPDECRCKCGNTDQRAACLGVYKMWDESRCACRCTNASSPCPTGSSFNVDTCRCERRVAGLIPVCSGPKC